MFDMKITGGLVVDGTGSPGRRADVGVRDGKVVGIATDGSMADVEATTVVDASDRVVAPGFVDIHTHYDAQILWDRMLTVSPWHGVTTVVMGNCGVGFAPVRASQREALIRLMEGVEDIPGTALHEGIRWEWESFPEYLEALERRRFALDVGAQLPHGAVRLYAMGERGADHAEIPTPSEIAAMAAIAQDAMRAGALGFSTSRTINHRSSDGRHTPSLTAGRDELVGVALGLREAGAGVLQVVSDFDDVDREFLYQVLLAREALGSTGVGDGIAIPHVRNPIVLHLSRPTVTLCFLERPVDFGALDGQPVSTLFTLISPTVRAHLHLLSRLAFTLRDARFHAAVRTQASREEILQALHCAESALGAPAAEPDEAARRD